DAATLQRINSVLAESRPSNNARCVFHSTYFTRTSCSVAQVATAHDMNHELFPDKYNDGWGLWLRQQYRDYLTHATRIVSVSQQTKHDVIRYYGINPSAIDVVHHGVNRRVFWPQPDPSYLTPGRGLTETALTDVHDLRRPYVLYVGNRDRR